MFLEITVVVAFRSPWGERKNPIEEVPAKLMMVGEGPEREAAENLVEELGIEDKVIFLGNSNEIDRILCFSDLFLLLLPLWDDGRRRASGSPP